MRMPCIITGSGPPPDDTEGCGLLKMLHGIVLDSVVGYLRRACSNFILDELFSLLKYMLSIMTPSMILLVEQTTVTLDVQGSVYRNVTGRLNVAAAVGQAQRGRGTADRHADGVVRLRHRHVDDDAFAAWIRSPDQGAADANR
jgi:hypothetical protein